MRTLLLALSLLIAVSSPVLAREVKLQWDRSSEVIVKEYWVYQGVLLKEENISGPLQRVKIVPQTPEGEDPMVTLTVPEDKEYIWSVVSVAKDADSGVTTVSGPSNFALETNVIYKPYPVPEGAKNLIIINVN